MAGKLKTSRRKTLGNIVENLVNLEKLSETQEKLANTQENHDLMSVIVKTIWWLYWHRTLQKQARKFHK